VVTDGCLGVEGRCEVGDVVVVAHEAGGDQDEEGVVAAVDDERAEDEEVADDRVAVDAFEDVDAVDERRALNMFCSPDEIRFELSVAFSFGSLRSWLFISTQSAARSLCSAALLLRTFGAA